jgi:hypothetical protein
MAEMTETSLDEPDTPRAPWATMVTTLLVLFLFGGALFALFEFGKAFQAPSAVENEQLRELRSSEREILDNYGYDAETKTYRIPIDRAMRVLIDESKAKGEMSSFPAPSKPKK